MGFNGPLSLIPLSQMANTLIDYHSYNMQISRISKYSYIYIFLPNVNNMDIISDTIPTIGSKF